MIKRCEYCAESTCKAAQFQNETYGVGKRVHNETEKKTASNKPVYRCTVCGREN